MQVETTPAYNFVGEHTDGVTPVPIPNTAVKPVRPMIVPLARKSVIAGILQTGRLELSSRRLFLRASPDSNLAILSILTFIPPYSGHGPHSYRLNSSTGRSQNHPRQLHLLYLSLPPPPPFPSRNGSIPTSLPRINCMSDNYFYPTLVDCSNTPSHFSIAGCHAGGFMDVLRTCLLIGVSSGAPKIAVCGRPSRPESYSCRPGPLTGRGFRLFSVGFQIQIQSPPYQGTWPT